MADSNSNRCSAVIPLDNQNGIECNGPASVLTEAGWRCSECFTEFGGVQVVTLDELAGTERGLHALRLEISAPVHVRIEPKPYDLGTLMCSVIDRVTGGVQ